MEKQLLEEKIRQSENDVGYVPTKLAVEILVYVHKALHRQLLEEIIEDLRNVRQSIARREGERVHFNNLDALESKYQHKLKELEDK